MMSKDWRNMEKKPLKRNLKMKKTSLPGSILSQLGKEWWKNLQKLKKNSIQKYFDKKVTALPRIFAVQMDANLWEYFKFIISQSAQPKKHVIKRKNFQIMAS